MGIWGNLARLAVAPTAAAAALLMVSVSGAAPGPEASVNEFQQCANGAPPSASTACPDTWINGILQSNNSHYAEDEVVPQRVLLELPKGSSTTGRTVEISYLTRKNGVHAYDSLATWNTTQTTADRCQGLVGSDCPGGAASTAAIPLDSTVVADKFGAGSATSGHQLTGQVFTMYGGTITGVSGYSHDDASGTSDSYARITITYSVPSTADQTKVLLLFGGHLAASLGPRGWGAGLGAGSISGGPYHIRITAADGASVGNRDNQIQSGAILAPSTVVIRKVAVGGEGTFDYTSTGGLSPASFSITTSSGSGSQSFKGVAPGSYTVTESGPPAGWQFTSVACEDEDGGSSVSGQTANIDLDSGETVVCTFTNTKRGKIIVEKQTDPDGASQLFSFTPSYGSSFQLSDGQQNDSGFLAPGTYSVSETVPSGWTLTSSTCDDGSSAGAISLQAGETVKCTFVNSQNGQVVVKKVMVGGTDTFSYSGTPAGTISTSGGTLAQSVVPGQYTSTEEAKAGWDLSSVACSDGNSSGSVGTRTATFNVEAGETVTCTFTNTRKATLIVKKVVVNDDGGTKTASDFSFQVNGGTAVAFEADGENVLEVAPGTYTVTEPAVSGYETSYSNCSDLVLAPGGSATCVITNDDQPATLIVKKVVVNDDGGTKTASDFSFQVNGGTAVAFEADGQNDLTVAAGTYTVTEPAVAGYETSYSNCSGLVIPTGGSATCTITNDDQPASLTVVKHVVNDDGGSAAASAWTMNVAGPTSLSFAGAESPGTTNQVDAGAYRVTESGGPSGYTLTYSGDCDAEGNVTLAPGASATCTLTNDDQAATLIVKKVVVNDDGGTKTASDFSFQVNGGSAVAFEADGENVLEVAPGTYSVTEPAVSGYETSYSNCSGIVLGLGETKTCTITNNDQAATLIVKKVVVNDSGGTKVASDFSFQVNGGSAVAFEADGQNDLTVTAGTYTVTEPAVAGYETSYSNCSGLVIPNGGSATCTITNDDRPAHLKLVKVVTNDNGGTAEATAWTLSASGPTPLSGPGGAEGDVDAGTYTLSESGGPAGYDASGWVCVGGSQEGSSITLGLGQSATCTIRNDDQAPKLTLVKEVVNDDGGTATASAWTLTATGPTGLSGAGPSVSSGPSFDQGSYDLSESGGPAGYDASAWECTGESQVDEDTVSLGLGDDVTCTITNDDRPATLIVKKVVVNDSGGTKTASDFSFSVNGGVPVAFEPDGQNDLTVAAGTYDVTELAVAGYTTSYSGCADIVLALGGTATCTITNNDVPRGQGSISVSKSASPTSLKEPGGQVAYSVSVTNTSADVAVTILDVSDDRFGDLDDEGGKGYVDVPFTLPPGGSKSFQFTAQVTGAGGGTHVNVVTASGRDASGNPVSGSDDARVAISERLIDLVVVKDATSPTPLNGTVTYTLSVTNKGPDAATNVQLADPAPAGITLLGASPSQGSCSVSSSLVTCALGTLASGQTVTVTVTGRATQVGQHTNTATVTGTGGRETNPADNVDSAVTVVPAPLRPPAAKPKPEPKQEVCLALTVTPKMLKADGKPDRVTVKVTAGKKPVKGVRVVISGAGVTKAAKTNGRGVAVLRINPKKAGLLTITAVEPNRAVCGPKRIGVVGVFLPPLTA